MKKLILSILFILCLSFQASAWVPTVVVSGSGAEVDSGCGGIQTFVGDPGDTETFEFEAADFCTTEFTETDPETIISTYDNTTVKNGTYALSIALDGVNREDNYVQADLGAADGDFTIDFWYYLYDDAGYNAVYVWSGSTTTDYAEGKLQIRHDRNATGKAMIFVESTVNNDQSIDITTGQWIRIEVDFNQNAASTVKIYDTTDTLKDTLNFTASNEAMRYFSWGCLYSNAYATHTYYYDDVRFKSSGGGF